MDHRWHNVSAESHLPFASFDRMGVLAQKGIKQLQDIATTMGDLYMEIRMSKNNSRNSTSMRNSWDEKYYMKRVSSAGISKMQTVNPMVDGHTIITQPKICVPRIDGRQENTSASDQSPNRFPLLATSLTVSDIEEESETSNDTDHSDDEDQFPDDSLVCRTPRFETMQEFYKRAYAQDAQEGPSSKQVLKAPLFVRKVPRGISKLPGHNFHVSSMSDECDMNRTSLCIVDMEETFVAEVPISQDVSVPKEDKKAMSSANNLSFNTVTGNINKSPPEDPSYEELFCLSKTTESQVVSKTKTSPDLTNTASNGDQVRSCTTPLVLNVAKGDSSTLRTPDSPDFLGFSSTTPPSSIKQKLHHNKPFDCATKPSKLSNAVHSKSKNSKVKVPSNCQPLHGNLSHSGSSKAASCSLKQSKLTEHSESLRVTASFSAISKPSNEQNNIEQSKASENAKESLKSSMANLSKCSSTKANKSNISPTPTKSFTVHLSDISLSKTKSSNATPSPITVPEKPLTPYTVRTTKHAKPPVSHSESIRSPSFVLLKHSALKDSGQIKAESLTIDSELPKETISVSQTKEDGCARPAKLTALEGIRRALNTPVYQPVEASPLETRSAHEFNRVLEVELKRLAATSEKTKKRIVGRPLRNRKLEDIENTEQLWGSSQRQSKRCSKLSYNLNDTPSRGSEVNTPNVGALVKKLDDSSISSIASKGHQRDMKRRALRRIAPTNYKEPHLNSKIRRPVGAEGL